MEGTVLHLRGPGSKKIRMKIRLTVTTKLERNAGGGQLKNPRKKTEEEGKNEEKSKVGCVDPTKGGAPNCEKCK